MKKIENSKSIKDAISEIEMQNASLKKIKKSSVKKVNNDNDLIEEQEENKKSISSNSVKEEVFYLAQQVKKRISENESKRKIELDKINKLCEREESKDRKQIEKLKEDLLTRYKKEQEKLERKLFELKKAEIEKLERVYQKEQEKINEMCKVEVLEAVKRYAEKHNWFEVAVQIYRANPEFFSK